MNDIDKISNMVDDLLDTIMKSENPPIYLSTLKKSKDFHNVEKVIFRNDNLIKIENNEENKEIFECLQKLYDEGMKVLNEIAKRLEEKNQE